MKLKKLLKDLLNVQVKGSKEISITGLSSNSKLIFPGNLFVARRGEMHDGNAYIPEAIASGAVAVLTDIFDPFQKQVVQLIHPHPQEIEAALAARYYEYPSRDLFTVGITGTNGKTTSSYLIKHLLESSGAPCGLIGTIEYLVGDQSYTASRTTPEAVSNLKLLREMCHVGCTAAVMEATSHALSQGRLREIEFDVALFTNLTQDHLDYHGSMEEYAKAKALLFKGLSSDATAVGNRDDPYFEQVVGETNARLLTFGIDRSADLMASELSLSPQGSRCLVSYKGETETLDWPGVGRYNIYNALGTITVALVKGISLHDACASLATFGGVRGRLERVQNALGLEVYVDYCHTDDALSNALHALREVSTGRLITVFGCGGDRDREKRPMMAKAAECRSDLVIVTSDNPRSEDPSAICDEVLQGFSDLNTVLVRVDRRLAIQRALEIATPDDVVLIAGKGHETTQEFSHQTVAFDDREVVKEICSDLCTEGCPT